MPLAAAAAMREVAAELVPGVPADAPLTEAGLDSLGVAELHNRLSSRLGDAELPEALAFDFPTLRQLEAHVATLAPAAAAPTAAAAAPGSRGSAVGATGGASGGTDGALLERLLAGLGASTVAASARPPPPEALHVESGCSCRPTRGASSTCLLWSAASTGADLLSMWPRRNGDWRTVPASRAGSCPT